ncbi:Stp1/IreP family PP2C-type Ser/Thr phosphatase [Rhabdothermincola sediminis]|uniref:Stp1/IreP family PP2C-type Ser/Thr phosphatase n=1 Tax=Rhabdothermincola sediminis TaxID=2751370 RepID=UPI001AA0676A|nr:Stp1/IreP family PP2C-type Ser/Thr phosphatase [Rhabdothermincola sediminis]
MTAFAWGAATDTGRVRPANEDFLLAADGLFVVADGMGGHKAGEVAAHLAVEELRARILDRGGPHTTDDLVEAVQEANAMLVSKAGEDPDLRGMGTTLCAMALVRDGDRDLLGVVNVGDSRLYLLTSGELEQITDDHSLVATLERQGRLTQAEAAVHPQRNILTRALGIDERVMVDSWEIVPFVGDRYLLCSDGLFNEVDDNRIASTLRRLADPTDAAHELVRLANEGGGRDNITCIVVDVIDDQGRDPAASPTDGRVAARVDGRGRVLAAAVGEPATASSDPGGTDVGGPAEEPGAGGAAPSPRARWVTWRVAVFLVVLLAIIGAAVGSIIYAGTSTYYVGFQGDQVAIFRGKPGGVLWLQPELQGEPTDLTREQLDVALQAELDKGKEQGSLLEAEQYVERIRAQARPAASGGPPASGTSGTATTGTTTGLAPTSTVEPPPQ